MHFEQFSCKIKQPLTNLRWKFTSIYLSWLIGFLWQKKSSKILSRVRCLRSWNVHGEHDLAISHSDVFFTKTPSITYSWRNFCRKGANAMQKFYTLTKFRNYVGNPNKLQTVFSIFRPLFLKQHSLMLDIQEHRTANSVR